MGPMNTREIAVIALICFGYYWLFGCFSAFFLSHKISLTDRDITIRVPETKNFFLLKMNVIHISLCDIAEINIGDEETIRNAVHDYSYREKINRYYKEYQPWSFYYTSGATGAVKNSLSLVLLTKGGQMEIVSTMPYSKKSIENLMQKLNGKKQSTAISNQVS